MMPAERVKVREFMGHDCFVIDVLPKTEFLYLQRLSINTEDARELYRQLAHWFAGSNVVSLHANAD